MELHLKLVEVFFFFLLGGGGLQGCRNVPPMQNTIGGFIAGSCLPADPLLVLMKWGLLEVSH